MFISYILFHFFFLVELPEEIPIDLVEVVVLLVVEAGVARVGEVAHELGGGYVVEVLLLQVVCVLALQDQVPVVVVPRTLVRVTQSCVGLVDVLEHLGRVCVLVLVWVPLQGCLLVTL